MFDHKPAAPLFAAFLLAGCASTAGDSYPSLAVRDVERAEGTFEPAAPRPVVFRAKATSLDATGWVDG